ncbi:MAG: HAMP domain-containing sensor histidine kinase [Acidobacteriota bacterium]
MSLRIRLFLTSLAIAVPLAAGWFVIDTHMRLATKEQELRRSVETDLLAGLQQRCEANPPRTGRPGRGGGPRQPSEPESGRSPRDTPPPDGQDDGRGSRDQGPRRPRGQGDGPPEDSPNQGRDPLGSATRPWRAAGDAPPRDEGTGPGPGPGGGPRRPIRGSGDAYQYFAYDANGNASSDDAPPLPANRADVDTITYWSLAGASVGLVTSLGGNGPCAYVLARIPPRPNELRDQTQALLLVVVSVLAAAWIAAGPVISRMRRLADGVLASAASHYAKPVVVEGRDEVASLAGAFNEAGQRVRAHLMEVQAREETLRSYVANTTHDVAIPLTVLQGHLAELDRELQAPEQRDHVRAAVQEAHYMGSLLRNLAAATKLDESTEPLALSPVDLSALVDRVVARHQPIARASNVELNGAAPDPPLVLPSDHTLLEQALSNLVDNAIRYNRAGGHVAVVLDRADDGFTLSVTDDGPGVTDEELARLTTRWFRGSEARTRRPDGKGLGLAIVAESVTRLGLDLSFARPTDTGLRAVISPARPQ